MTVTDYIESFLFVLPVYLIQNIINFRNDLTLAGSSLLFLIFQISILYGLYVGIKWLIQKIFSKKEPVSDEMKEFLENAEWKDVTMPNGDVVSMPYKKEWEKETLAYELLRKRELEEE
jgi:hypothetical protein